MLYKSDCYNKLPGTIRAKTPAESLSFVSPLFPKLGITRVSNITGLDNIGIDVSICVRPNAKFLTISQGKGCNKALADLSAIMEGVELFHAENPPPYAFRLSYYDAVKNFKNVINPLIFSKGDFNCQNIEIKSQGWVEAKELISNSEVYIPHSLTVFDMTISSSANAYYNISTNGLAAGNTISESLCHSLYEVVERNALYKWQNLESYEKKKCLVNLETIDDESANILINKILKAGYKLKIWHITDKTNISSFHCALYDLDLLGTKKIFTGTGSHFKKSIAICRAISESAQSRLTYITGSRDDIFSDYYNVSHDSCYYKVEPELVGLSYTNCIETSSEMSFSSDVKKILNCIKTIGITEVYFVERTRDDIGLPVTQIIIPGFNFNKSRM